MESFDKVGFSSSERPTPKPRLPISVVLFSTLFLASVGALLGAMHGELEYDAPGFGAVLGGIFGAAVNAAFIRFR